MKRYAILLLWLMPGLHVAAQPWCPSIGAQWWHTYSMVGGLYGSVRTTYASDSLIAGESWQKLNVVATYQDLSSGGPTITETWFLLTRVEENTVFLRQAEEVDTLFRFDATVGDRWSVPFTTAPELTYVVTDVGQRTVDGIELAWAAVDVLADEGLYFSDTLVERLGFLDQFIHPESSLNLELNILGLRCHSDDAITYQKHSEEPCDVGLLVQQAESSLRHVWYDEATGTLRSPDIRPLRYTVWDVAGRTVVQGRSSAGLVIPVEHLPAGVYALGLVDESGRTSRHTWAKN